MNIERVVVGNLRTNVWLIEGMPETPGAAPSLIVIDPGDEPDKILDAIAGRPVAAVLVTHGHFDHISYADEIADETGSYFYLSEIDAEGLPAGIEDLWERYQVRAEVPRIDFRVAEGDVLRLAGLEIEVWITPGHTPGSTGYMVKEPDTGRIHYFSGDTLFARDVGRTDLLGGDPEAMQTSLERIAQLSPDTAVYPGHGPATTIAREAAANSWWPS